MNSSLPLTASCGFPGNSDIYGIGIRTGYYTQALAVYFSNFFVLSEAKNLRAVNGLFLLALGIVAAIYAYNAATTYAIEVFILLQTGLCLGLVSIMEGTRYSSKYLPVQKERLILRTILMNWGMGYNLWFWWRGLDSLMGTPCGTYVLYVVRVDMYGPVRTVMKAFAVVVLVWRTLFTTAWDAGKTIWDVRMRKARATFVELAHQRKNVKPPVLFVSIAVQTDEVPEHSDVRVAPKVTNVSCVKTNTPDVENIGSLQLSAQGPRQPLQSSTQQDAAESHGGTSEASPKPSPKPDLDFEIIKEAENYLDEVFRPYSPVKPRSKEKHGSSRPRLSKPQSFSKVFGIYLPDAHYKVAVKRTIMASFADCNTRRMKDTLSIHSQALQLRLRQWPITVDRMLDKNMHHPSPDWHALAIASDVQLTQMSYTRPRRVWMLLAAKGFVVIVLLILQIELAIGWNGIYGLSGLNTVGQLIPLILGIGGLVQVLWEKWCHVRNGIRASQVEAEKKRLSKYEEAMEQYLEWKKRL
ncbi:hypothetical protein MMC17_000569 [Xylographa soralifera]|nr:hypothetical protein [Xylographa soralifera]